MRSNYTPPDGFTQIESKLEGIMVFAPAPEIDITPEALQFECPQCGASTTFTPSIGGVTCQHCGYTESRKLKAVGRAADEREFTRIVNH